MLASSIAYTTALSLAPFILILLSIAALISDSFQNDISAQLSNLLGKQAGSTVAMVVQNAGDHPKLSTLSGLLGFLVLAVSASVIFGQLRSAFDIIMETPEEDQAAGLFGFLRERLLSVGLVFGFVFLLVTSLAVSTILSSLFAGGEALVWKSISFALNIILFTLLFTSMFRFIPTVKLPWLRSLKSGFCATAFFLTGKWLIGIYLGNAAIGSEYGAAGSLVVFLVWVYYSSLTILVSFEFSNEVLADPKGGRVTPALPDGSRRV